MLGKNKIKKDRRLVVFLPGLTLIELMVSLSIIAFVTAIFVTNYQTANKRTDLVMAAQVLVADIHRAQNNSLGLIKYGELVPAGGWGISFDIYNNKNQYTVFADLDEPGTSRYRFVDPGEYETNLGARIVDLPPQIEISAIRIGEGTTNQRYAANVTFLPPDPQVNIFSMGATSSVLEIDLKELKNNNVKTIRVNFLGLAEVLE